MSGLHTPSSSSRSPVSQDHQSWLVANNRLELLMFTIEGDSAALPPRVFGINVFKVRELLEVPRIVRVPGCQPCVAGLANVRGTASPVIDLHSYCGITTECPQDILMITEFNGGIQGFLLNEVLGITQLAWSDIKPPPDIFGESLSTVLTAISPLEDGTLLLILDAEKILADVLGTSTTALDGSSAPGTLDDRLVFFVEDSSVAHAQIEAMLDHMQVPNQSATNGHDGLTALMALADQADEDGVALRTRLQAIVTDIEMPIMDGYVLTQHIKQDPRFAGIPVMMHSSLSTAENVRMALQIGADACTPKLQPEAFRSKLQELVQSVSDEAP